MRKILLLTLFLCSTAIIYAQETTICGDWTGNYTVDAQHKNWKRFIRIKKYGDNYIVRMKEIDLDFNRTYYSDCVVTSSDDNSISFYVYYPKSYDNDDKEWSESKMFWNVYFVDSVLKFRSQGSCTKIYDLNNNIKEINYPPHVVYNMNLYKDDSDW